MKAPKGVRQLIEDSLDLIYKIKVQSENGRDEKYQEQIITRLHLLNHWANDSQYLYILLKDLRKKEKDLLNLAL